METQEPLEPLPIDDRSPGERWVQQGRAGMKRFRETAERQHFGTWALIWMLLTLLALGTEIYSVLRFGNTSGFPGIGDGWYKALLLGESTSGFSLACMVGVGLAAPAPGSRSTAALSTAVLIGGWTVAAAIVGIAAVAHGLGDQPPLPTGDKLVECGRFVANGGLGFVVIFVALRVRGARGPEPAEVS
jgi:hypothetical protein